MSCAATTLNPNRWHADCTSLDPVESTVRLPAGTAIYGDNHRGYKLHSPQRHAGWANDRTKVFDALVQSNQPGSRLRAFAACGKGAYVLRRLDKPHEYAIVPHHCHDRFCKPCAAERAWAIQRNLSKYLPRHPCRFVTLTLRSGAEPLSVLLDRLRTSFTRLRKHAFWTGNVKGGVGFLEVKWSESSQRWHPHLHLVVHGSYLRQSTLSNLWNDITGGSFIVDVRLIRTRKAALQYVTKYATKGYDQNTLAHPSRLAECVDAMKGRKLCHAFGDWAKLQLLATDTEGDWELLCPLDDLGSLARRGDADAILVSTKLLCDTQTPVEIRQTRHPPPDYFANPWDPQPPDVYALRCYMIDALAERIAAAHFPPEPAGEPEYVHVQHNLPW
jgi:hypothetical protein